MYGANVDMAQVQVSAAYQEDINAFNIHFYEEQLCSLEEAQSYNAYYIMMEIMLGEDFLTSILPVWSVQMLHWRI